MIVVAMYDYEPSCEGELRLVGMLFSLVLSYWLILFASIAGDVITITSKNTGSDAW